MLAACARELLRLVPRGSRVLRERVEAMKVVVVVDSKLDWLCFAGQSSNCRGRRFAREEMELYLRSLEEWSLAVLMGLVLVL